MSFGDNIRFIRGNLSQAEFGLLFHVHRNTVSLWETDFTMPQGEIIIQLHDLLNVNLNWLFSGEGEPYRDESG
jgi:transcriptional regulator with XRE-family HTH domain